MHLQPNHLKNYTIMLAILPILPKTTKIFSFFLDFFFLLDHHHWLLNLLQKISSALSLSCTGFLHPKAAATLSSSTTSTTDHTTTRVSTHKHYLVQFFFSFYLGNYFPYCASLTPGGCLDLPCSF